MRAETTYTFTKEEMNVLADFYDFIEDTDGVYYEDVERILYELSRMRLNANTISQEDDYTIRIED